MAYVTGRRGGRFEIRESLHTPKGSRARSLASFEVLDDDVLDRAEQRSSRPFDVDAVIASGRRAGARVIAQAGAAREARDSPARFVEASRRMALSFRRRPHATTRADPGDELIDLLGFADAVTASQPVRPFEPLAFPVLSRLVQARHAPVASHS
jgi:hypothetical protein